MGFLLAIFLLFFIYFGGIKLKIKMQKKEKEKTFKDAFKEFILYSRVKNLADATLNYYEESYQQFLDFFGEGKLCHEINDKTINEYILYMQSHTKCNPTTINTRIRGLRAILYYMMKLGYIEKFHITIRKSEKKIKTTYTESELKLLLKKPDIKHCAFYEYRSWVISNTLLGTGMRAGSLCNLKINDVDFENLVFYLRHMKARRQIIIPMVITLKKILLEYLEYRQATKDDDFLFCSVYGMQLNTNSLAHSLRKYSLRRGVTKSGLHKYRHTYAKMYLQNGGDVFKLQKLLGHRTLDMTREYVEMFTDDLKVDYDIINPLEHLQANKKQITIKK